MCCLNESWALAYFQVAVSILIFGVGIPSLVLQTVVPEDLRRIVHRHLGLLRWGFLLILVFMLIALVFIWIIHPCDTLQPSLLTTTLGLNIDQWVAAGIITLAIVGVGLVWYLYALHRSDRILDLLRRKCEQHVRRQGVPDERVLEDIRYFGEQAKTGREKIRVLRVLELLAKEVQAHKRYEGNGLGDIIEAIEFTLQKGTDINSFARGILTLKRIVENLQKSELASPADTGSVLRALRRLGKITCTMDNVRPALIVLGTFKFVSGGPNGVFSEAALALLELGSTALENKTFLVAAGALNRLEAMIWPKQPLDAQTSAAYLGLLAHFWAKEGSACQHASSSLEGVEFTPSRQQCLREAQEIHYRAARFDTADKLADMIADLKVNP